MRTGLIVAGALALVGAGTGPTSALGAATTLTVASPSDVTAGDPTVSDLTCDTALASPAMGACTLRAAIQTVNARPPGSGPYTIVVPAGHYLLTERYEISKAVTITGAGANATIIDGQNAHNPFFISSAGLNVAISGLEITGGHSFPRGGGIYNYGNLELAEDWITGNTASEQGGGVYNNGGNLTIISSTISANNSGNGAGVNSGQLGGGQLGTLSVVNSTISGNAAATDGGGIRALNDTGTTLLNDTIAANTAGTAGGGLDTESPSGPITLRNTIVAGNTVAGVPSDCAVAGGLIDSKGHNVDQSGACHLGGAGDLSLNPMLGPLAYNGGSTETMALPLGSAAIDAGDPSACPATDQRGVPRPPAIACDIGAFEGSYPPSATSATTISGTAAPGKTLTCTAASFTGAAPVAITYQWLRDGTAIPGATASAYGVSSSDAGHVLTCVVTATNPDGSTPSSSSVKVLVFSTLVPVVSAATQSASMWREGGGLAQVSRKRKPPVGTTFSFTLNEVAAVRMDFAQATSGRRSGRKCVRPTRKNHRARRCTLTTIAGTLSFTGHEGLDKVRFEGRVSRSKKLKPGRYTLIIAATASTGARSAPVELTFTIVKS